MLLPDVLSRVTTGVKSVIEGLARWNDSQGGTIQHRNGKCSSKMPFDLCTSHESCLDCFPQDIFQDSDCGLLGVDMYRF